MHPSYRIPIVCIYYLCLVIIFASGCAPLRINREIFDPAGLSANYGNRTLKVHILYMYQRRPGLYAGITGLLYIPDIIAAIALERTGFLLIGLPGLICGTIVTILEGNNLNILKYPGKNSKYDLIKYSRFPQGMPQGIDKSKLHLVSFR